MTKASASGAGAIGCSALLALGAVALPVVAVGGTLLLWWGAGLWDGDLLSVGGLVLAMGMGAVTPPVMILADLLGATTAIVGAVRGYRVTGVLLVLVHVGIAAAAIAALVAWTVPLAVAVF